MERADPQGRREGAVRNLSGILDSLEVRNRQAIEGKLAYTEFLAMLVSDEVARRENKKFSLRLRRAQFLKDVGPV